MVPVTKLKPWQGLQGISDSRTSEYKMFTFEKEIGTLWHEGRYKSSVNNIEMLLMRWIYGI